MRGASLVDEGDGESTPSCAGEDRIECNPFPENFEGPRDLRVPFVMMVGGEGDFNNLSEFTSGGEDFKTAPAGERFYESPHKGHSV